MEGKGDRGMEGKGNRGIEGKEGAEIRKVKEKKVDRKWKREG